MGRPWVSGYQVSTPDMFYDIILPISGNLPYTVEIRKRGRVLAQWLPAIRVVQVILSIAVIFFILLQVRGAGLGSAFGGSSAGSVFKTRRGVERLIFNITIVFVILFAAVSLLGALLR